MPNTEAAHAMNLLDDYIPIPGTRDEVLGPDGAVQPALRAGLLPLLDQTAEGFERRQRVADAVLLDQGVTFSVYSDDRGTEKIFPFCLMPRPIAAAEWRRVEAGLVQRLRALELFLDDVYAGPQRLFADGVVPREIVLGASNYLAPVRGVRPPGGVRIAIGGIDLVRDGDGVLRVLEDNLRTPSGVSYVLENRLVTKRVFAPAFHQARVARVDGYPQRLADMLRSIAPEGVADPAAVILTPGRFNSAYFEHGFLARTTGLPLVEASDLFVQDERVFLRTTRGPAPVHVIYRRTDETWLDPHAFRPESLIGVPGIIRAWARGNVTLANAPGNGVADDKAIYPWVPEFIRYYLSEEPLLAQVPTYVCARDDDRAYVLEHLDELVVKAVDEAGGYGMLMGPTASRAERADFARAIVAQPRRYIAQHRLELSTTPTWIAEKHRFEPRRVDLRPFVLTGRDGAWVLPGGLTRVALPEGSYVVNSSQGGGSKDTWVIGEEGPA